jgi:MinD-like ATPase involved in chromosome partitioning or flagellar assembly
LGASPLARGVLEYVKDDEQFSELLVLPEIPARVAPKRTEGSNLPIVVAEPASDAATTIKELVKRLKREGAL